MNSGWAARSGSVAAYRNVGADGLQHFPLLEGRSRVAGRGEDVAGIGVDTLSLDPGRSQTFDAHLRSSAPTGTGSRTWRTSTACRSVARP